MRCLQQSGRGTEAVAVFERCSAALHSAGHTGPSKETRAMLDDTLPVQ